MISTRQDEVNFIQLNHAEISPILEYLGWSKYMVEKLYRPPTRPSMESELSLDTFRSLFLWIEVALRDGLAPNPQPPWIPQWIRALGHDRLELRYVIQLDRTVILGIPEEYIVEVKKYISKEKLQELCMTLDRRLPKRLKHEPMTGNITLAQRFIQHVFRTSDEQGYVSRYQQDIEGVLMTQVLKYPVFVTMLRKKVKLTEYYQAVRAWVDRFTVGRKSMTPRFAAKYLGIKEAYSDSTSR